LKTDDRLREYLRSKYHFDPVEQHLRSKSPEYFACELSVVHKYRPKGARIAPRILLVSIHAHKQDASNLRKSIRVCPYNSDIFITWPRIIMWNILFDGKPKVALVPNLNGPWSVANILSADFVVNDTKMRHPPYKLR